MRNVMNIVAELAICSKTGYNNAEVLSATVYSKTRCYKEMAVVQVSRIVQRDN